MKQISGQSLIGILVALAIFSILSQAVLTIASTSYRFVSYNRARITARHLAQEKIEFIRNLPYDRVGTSGGIPSGTLAQNETIKRNGINFDINLSIVYVDDPFDGTQGGSPSDTLATDYKRVRVSVSWQGIEGPQNPIVLLTDIAPKGVETTQGGGTLSVIVFDSNGSPVPEASIHIVQNTVSPNIDVTFQTADNGRFIFTGVPACVACYQISITKDGYSSDRTYSTDEVANPSKAHQTVIEGQLTEISFSIDRISTINIATKKGRDDNFEALGNISFRLRGEKIIGTDSQGDPVHKYDKIHTTNQSGFLTLTNMEWDNYHFIPNPPDSYDISGTQPPQPLILTPGSEESFSISLVVNSPYSVLLTFVNQQENPIASVSATLSGDSFTQNKISGNLSDPDFGQVYFGGLPPGNYSLTATHSAFLDHNATIQIDNTDITEEVMLLPK